MKKNKLLISSLSAFSVVATAMSALPLSSCSKTKNSSEYIFGEDLDKEYDVAVQMDGDGQHPASQLPLVLRPILDDQADMVIGSRFINKDGFQSSFMRRVGIKVLSDLVYLTTGKRVFDVTSGFRAINKKMIKVFARDYAQDYPEPDSLILAVKHQARIVEVPIIMQERKHGNSSITALKSVYYMIKVTIELIFDRITFRRPKE